MGPSATPVSFVPPVPVAPERDNRAALEHGMHALRLATPAAALRHLAECVRLPVALAETAPSSFRDAVAAAGVELRLFPFSAHSPLDIETLAPVARGALVVVPCPFGLPADPRALELGELCVEDRTQAALTVHAPQAPFALVDPRSAFDIADGALLLSSAPLPEPHWRPVDAELVELRAAAGALRTVPGAHLRADELTARASARAVAHEPRPMSPPAADALHHHADLDAARSAHAAAGAILMAALGDACPFDGWPVGHVPHGFPVRSRDARGTVAALAAEGVEARTAPCGLVVLPCHAGVDVATAERVAAAAKRAGVAAQRTLVAV